MRTVIKGEIEKRIDELKEARYYEYQGEVERREIGEDIEFLEKLHHALYFY